MIEVKICSTPKEIIDNFELRRIIFIQGQNVPEDLELDGLDEFATLLVAYEDETPVGCGRYRLMDGYAKIERIGVLKNKRSLNIGRLIMEKIEEEIRDNTKIELLKLNSQTHAQLFYEKLGYIPKGDVFDEAGIDHILMVKAI